MGGNTGNKRENKELMRKNKERTRGAYLKLIGMIVLSMTQISIFTTTVKNPKEMGIA